MKVKIRNPWVRRDMAMSRLIWGQTEIFPNQLDAEAAPTLQCPCGTEGYYHPAVGTWKCPACGKVYCGNGKWM